MVLNRCERNNQATGVESIDADESNDKLKRASFSCMDRVADGDILMVFSIPFSGRTCAEAITLDLRSSVNVCSPSLSPSELQLPRIPAKLGRGGSVSIAPSSADKRKKL